MSTEPGAYPAASASVKPAAVGKPKFDPRYIAPLFITCVLIAAHLSIGALESPQRTGLAILAAMATEIILGKLTYGKIPHLASAYVSGISVGILVRSPFFWPYAMCAILSIMSKYVLRVDDRHIWNPSNFGISAMLFLAPVVVAPLSVQFGNSIVPMIVIWCLGTFIISRLKRFHICASYVGAFVLLAAVRSALTGQGFLAEVAPITGPPYQLFIFFMITDPKTTVSTKRGQIIAAIMVAVVESVFRGIQGVQIPLFHGYESFISDLGLHAPYYALFLVGPIANLLEIRKKRIQKAASGAPAATARA